jgi:hypothetical protein
LNSSLTSGTAAITVNVVPKMSMSVQTMQDEVLTPRFMHAYNGHPAITCIIYIYIYI